MNRKYLWLPTIAAVLTLSSAAFAEEAASITPAQFVANNIWMMFAAALVFGMHLGFASLEIGMSQSKNTVNILF